jgi:biopolymer transport protein ExbD
MQVNRSSSLQSEINITPLVDVVLVLLIIFMVVVPLLMQGYDVDIPKLSMATAAPDQADQVQMILKVTPESCRIVGQPDGQGLPDDCRVTLDDKEIAAAELPARAGELLSGRPVEGRVLYLAADDRLNYEGVLRIVDLAKSGVADLRIEFITTD